MFICRVLNEVACRRLRTDDCHQLQKKKYRRYRDFLSFVLVYLKSVLFVESLSDTRSLNRKERTSRGKVDQIFNRFCRFDRIFYFR